MNAPVKAIDQRWIEQAEAARDLKAQLNGLEADESSEIQFTEWSPGRTYVTIWSTTDGEEVNLPRYQARAAMNTQKAGGGWAWTTNKELAPERKVNNVKCFLHPAAPERTILNEMGIVQTCVAAHLANNGSKRTHAEHRPGSLWAQYREELADREKVIAKKEDRERTDAILKLAGRAGKE